MKKLQFFLTILMVVSSYMAVAQSPFTPGNVVLVRYGDGVTSYASKMAPVFLDEITPAGALVQSVALPTVDNGANFKVTGYFTRGNWGFLTRSQDKQYLAFAGLTSDPGTSFPFGGPFPDRTIARIDYNGAINTSTIIPGTDLSTTQADGPVTSITDNGLRFWTSHDGIGGIRYSTLGSSASSSIFSGNVSTVNIENNQLYCTSNQKKPSIVSGGLPTSGPQTITAFPGIPTGFGSSSQFFMADLNPAIPGFDVIYLSNSDEGITKYSLVGSSWVSNGVIGDFDVPRGITGVVNGSSVTLYCTRMIDDNSSTGQGQLVKFIDNTGYNPGSNTFNPTETILRTASSLISFRGVAMAPEAPSVKVSLKAYLQGAYSSTTGRHKDVTTTWAGVLNANALGQPYNVAAFGNYAGTESVTNGFFTSNTANDVVDWVLVELRDKNNPATLIARKAGFIREDGTIVGTDGNTLTISGAGDDSYYIVIRHRNHLAIRSANPIALNGTTATLYDFTDDQNKAYQNPSVPGNAAMATKDLPGTETGKFLLWGGNANGDGFIRASGASNVSDYLTLLGPLCLQGDFSKILNSVYRKEDMNLDGVVRASAALNVNDYITLLSTGILAGNTSNIIAAH